MSYIGNVPTTAAFPFDQFSGTGAQVAFTLSQAPASTTSIAVTVSGVVQNPNTYSVSGTTLTFTEAPPSGTNNIGVLFLGLPAIVGAVSDGDKGDITVTGLGNTWTIDNDVVTTAKIADGAATLAKLDTTGAAGAVLTAGGVGVDPTWSAISTAQVLTATAGATAGAIGSYAFLARVSNKAVSAQGTTVAGSDLRYSNAYSNNDQANEGSSAVAPAGTWRIMGNTGYLNQATTTSTLDGFMMTLFLRIS